jgi:hypothetical protein
MLEPLMSFGLVLSFLCFKVSNSRAFMGMGFNKALRLDVRITKA